MHYVYAIRSLLQSRVYVGQTKDLERRLTAHNKGRVKSTRNGGSWELIAVQPVKVRPEARWIERKLKASQGARLAWLRKHGIPSPVEENKISSLWAGTSLRLGE
jgi:putative endonuclease